MNNNKGNTLVILVLVLAFVGVCGNIIYNSVRPKVTHDQTVGMVQPCGWFWCADYDSQYAEHVNQPNSEANRNNAEAHLLDAQATQTVGESYANNGWSGDFWFGAVISVIAMGIIFVVGSVLIFGSKGK